MQEKDLDQFRMIIEELFKKEIEEPVAEPIPSEELFSALDLSLNENPINDEEFYDSLKELVLNTPRTSTKLFFNQLFAGRKSKSVLGDLLSIVLNNSMYTYKVAGPMVGVEKEVVRKTSQLVGYGDESDGTIVTGGSMANFMAMVMARDAFNEKIRMEGVSTPMILYTSKDCHYSIAKNASLMGIGRSQVRFIEVDEMGRMIPEKLEEAIQDDKSKGLSPFFINATAGTTVLGAFDPVDALSDIAEKHQLWLHIDGAYCGAVVFSDEYKRLLKGVERSDSFNVNAHKMLGTPLTCSVFVAKNKIYLNHSFSSEASYLYQTDNDDFNLGKTSLQCGRKNDALKLWTLWKSIGRKGLGQLVDHQFQLANVAREYIENHPDYSLYSFGDSISVCFNYKGHDPKALCTALYEKAKILVGFGTANGETFIRLVTVNADNQEEDIINFFNELEEFVEEHQEQLDQAVNVISS